MTWQALTTLFDRLKARSESPATRRLVAATLVAVFLGTVAAVELNRLLPLPPALGRLIPPSHFHAVQAAMYLLLAYEVMGLVFGLATSFTVAAGKQFEIFSLILLRQSLEAFGEMHEPLAWPEMREHVVDILSGAAGALVIFVVVGFYYGVQRHQPLTPDVKDRRSFIAAKKVLALVLLVVFSALAVRSVLGTMLGWESHLFFEPFYTLLVFADILVVLLSMRYSASYPVVFRNSGLALATVMLRMALVAPPVAGAVLGSVAAVFALALTRAYNLFTPVVEQPPGP
jgi:hypothetical protein